MRAMILAAGRGKRMRHLSEHTPKPLLQIAKKPLIVRHLEALKKAGIRDVVINLGHLGEKIESTLRNGQEFGVNIQYSYEDPILDTGGGIVKVLSWLGSDPFLVISADIFTHYQFDCIPKDPKELAHVVLVDNPPHHPTGDFALVDGYVKEKGGPLLNFAGIGVYRPELFSECQLGIFPLSLLFKKALQFNAITGEYYEGVWHNIGTPEQLEEINQQYSNLNDDEEITE